MDRKLAPITLAVAFLVVGCGSTTPTAPPPSLSGSPVAQVQASAPVVNGVQVPRSSTDSAPSASAARQPSPTPDPDALRTAAAAGFQAAADANAQAFNKCTGNKKCVFGEAEIWGLFAADLKKIQVPIDTAADLHTLIRRVVKLQALTRQASGHFDRWADWDRVAIHRRNTQSKMADAVDQVRSDLGLPALCRAGCPGLGTARLLLHVARRSSARSAGRRG